MSLIGRSLVTLKNWSQKEVQELFFLSSTFKNNSHSHISSPPGKVVALAFFEPSTRTKLSFQMALGRLGLMSSDLGTLSDSSMVKGESFSETLKTIEAMEPDLMVLRTNSSQGEIDIINQYSRPVISAGCGPLGHPTQALADAFTIRESYNLQNFKILFVGDINHSRVVRSNINLLSLFPNVEFGFCGPKEFLPPSDQFPHSKNFSHLEEALSWADICMGLRVQLERHASASFSPEDYKKNYRLTADKLNKHFKKEGLILHPGPHIPEVDFDPQIFNDPRCVVRKQVTNGVFVRMSIMASFLGLVKR